MFFSPEAILDYLKIYLPRLTDYFSTNTAVTAEIIDGTPQILRITKNNHGLSAGNEVVTIDGLIDNSITAVQDVGDENGDKILRFTTNKDHDLTLGYTQSVTLSGFTDSGLNVTFDLYGVPSRTIFEIVYSSVPTLNGNEVLREVWENGINGKFEIDSATTNTFDILLTDKPIFEPGQVSQIGIVESFRMSVVADFERAKEMYTSQDSSKNWLFVIMNDSNTSKDRNVMSDAVASNTAQNPQRLKLINTFFINTILNTTEDLSAANASQISWNEILSYMLGVMSGVTFETFGNSDYVTTMINHGSTLYDKAFYGHSYTFEYVYEITDLQTFTQQIVVSRAFRNDALSFAEIQEGSEINLDEEV